MKTSTWVDAFEFVTNQGQFKASVNRMDIRVELAGGEVGSLRGTM